MVFAMRGCSQHINSKYHCLPCQLHIQLYCFHTLHLPCKVDYQTRRRLHLFAYHQLPFAKFLPENLPSFRSQQADSIDSYVRYLCSNQLPFSALFLTQEVRCYSLLSPRPRFRKAADGYLKNHYIISNKTLINDGKNTYTKRFCNHKEINQL